jgi:hypothetical protein
VVNRSTPRTSSASGSPDRFPFRHSDPKAFANATAAPNDAFK